MTLSRHSDNGQVIRLASLHAYAEECAENARLAAAEGRDEDEAWWLGEELAALGAALEVERS